MKKELTSTKPAAEQGALAVQVGGGHYKKLAIQPVEYGMKNGLNFCQGNIVKYASRYPDKGGAEDLEKVKHYADLAIELEYPEHAAKKREFDRAYLDSIRGEAYKQGYDAAMAKVQADIEKTTAMIAKGRKK